MTPADIAANLLAARREKRALAGFPAFDAMTPPLSDAVQRAMAQALTEPVGGWKVGMIAPPLRPAFGRERFLGPVLSEGIVTVLDAPAVFHIIPGGTAACEAEFIVRIGRDVAAGTSLAPAEAMALVTDTHIGLELLSSAVPNLTDCGSLAIVADLGFSGGLVLGAKLGSPTAIFAEEFAVTMSKNGAPLSEGGSSAIVGGYHTALHYGITAAAATGRGLRAGDYLSLGALAGLHVVTAGDRIVADFGSLGQVSVTFA